MPSILNQALPTNAAMTDKEYLEEPHHYVGHPTPASANSTMFQREGRKDQRWKHVHRFLDEMSMYDCNDEEKQKTKKAVVEATQGHDETPLHLACGYTSP
jgi:hypothetical protein